MTGARFIDILDELVSPPPPVRAYQPLHRTSHVWLHRLFDPYPAVTRPTPAGDIPAAFVEDPRRDHPPCEGQPEPRPLTDEQRLALSRLRELGVDWLDDRLTSLDLKKAHRWLAMRFHPDRHPTANAAEQRRLSRSFTAAREAVLTLLHTLEPTPSF